MASNEIDYSRNVCAICLNNEDGIKLYKMKVIEQFFVDIVGISQVEYEKTPKLLCVWCASRASRAMQLVSRARASTGVLSRAIAKDGNSRLVTSEFQVANLHNLTHSNGSVINIEIIRENYEEDKSISTFVHHELKSDRFVNNGSCDNLTKASVKSEFDGSMLSDENNIFENNGEERKVKKILKKKTVKEIKNQSTRRKKNGVKAEKDGSPATNPRESDHDLSRLQFSVQELTEEQQLAELERRRRTEEFRDARYKCSHCALVILCPESEMNHAERHKQTAGPHICPICSLRFISRGAFSHHRLSHRRVFVCVPCGRRVLRRALLQRHRARCPAGGRVGGPVSDGFRCGACEREFGDRESVRTHYRRAHGGIQSVLRCEHCEKTFTRKYNLIVHIRSHTQEKPYSCPHCRRGFSVSSNLRAHISLIHQERLPGLRARPYCVECDRHFTTARSLTRHLKRTAAHRQKD